MRQQWVRRDHNVTARNEHAHRLAGKIREERAQGFVVRLIQYRKSRQRLASTAIEGRRNAPDTPAPSAQLLLLYFRVLLQPVRRVSDDRVYRIGFAVPQPIESV